MSGRIPVFLFTFGGINKSENMTTLPLIHIISVILFLVIYLIKTPLLLANKTETLARVTKVIKVPEMIVSFMFLVTGVWMLVQLPVINSLLIIKIVIVLLSIPIAIVGFKKRNKALAAIALLMIIAAYGLGEVSKKKRIQGNDIVTNSVTATKEDFGKAIYDAKCVNCHGADGTAGISGAKDLSQSTLSEDEIEHIVHNGKGMMPPTELADEQLHAVAEYVKTLKK
jgi:uncharacterized membrane protein SirB2